MAIEIFTICLPFLSLILYWHGAIAEPLSASAVFSSDLPKQTCIPGAPRNLVTNPHSSLILGDSNGWIWIKGRDGKSVWHKLIPGRFPQWRPDGKLFYYFLDVGYDGSRSEIWSAQPDGECRVRESSADFWIKRTPIFSPGPERRLAYYYQTSMASGDLDEIVVVDLEHVDRPGQGRVVYKRESDSAIDPDSLRWKNPMTLEVRINGAWTAIDATAPGEAVKP